MLLTSRRQGKTVPLLVFLLVITFCVGLLAGYGVVSLRTGPVPRDLGPTFAEAWNLTRTHYVDRKAAQPHPMTQGAIRGMLDGLGDDGHTTFLTQEEVEHLESDLKGEFEGIGATLSRRNRRPVVAQVVPNSPARAAGLQRGDVLLEIDGGDVGQLPLERIVEKVRGPAGTTVELRVSRPGYVETIIFRIRRASVQIPEVTWQVLPGHPVAHVQIHAFGQNAHGQLRSALRAARARGVEGLILDVRGNPGGLKEQAVAVTSEFLRDGNVFIEQDEGGNQVAIPVAPGGGWTEIPLAVLIDEGTASSAEILAGAIRDHGRGQLVGTRTYGTGTVLQPFRLSDGSAVLLAVKLWLTPNGHKIWHEGIQPDREVELPENAEALTPQQDIKLTAEALAKSGDRQLLHALELLGQQLQVE